MNEKPIDVTAMEYGRILEILQKALRERSLGFPWSFLLREARQRIARGRDGESRPPQKELLEVRSRVLTLCDELLIAPPTGHRDPLRQVALTVDQWANEYFTRKRRDPNDS